MRPPHPPQRAKRSAAAVHGTRAGAPRNTAGTTSQSRPRRTAQRPPHGSKQGKALQRREAGARGTKGHAHRRTPSAQVHTSAGRRSRPAACTIMLLMRAACCKPPRESPTKEASLCPGRAAARMLERIRRIIGYAAASWRRRPAHERPFASTAKPRAAAGRAGLGAKFRPSSSMARYRLGPFSPVLDGRFIAHNTLFSNTIKKGPAAWIALAARSFFCSRY